MDELLIVFAISLLFGILALIAWKWPTVGLALMPVVFLGGIVTAVANEDIFVAVTTLLTWPLMTGIICLAPQTSPLESPWYKTVSKLLLTAYTYATILVLMILLFNFFGALLFILLVVAVVRYVLVRKYAGILEVISIIGMSIRQSLPLPMALQTAAHGQNPKITRILISVAHWLTQGYSLSESLCRGYRKCPPDILASIAAAEKMNQLSKTIEIIQTDISEKVSDYKRIRPVHPWYPLIVLIVVSIIILALMVKVVPTFAEVLSDVSGGTAGLPWMTQILLNASRWLTGDSKLNFILTLALILLMICYLVYLRFHRRNPLEPRPLSRIGDWLKWHLPIIHWFEKNYSQLQLTEILKVGLRAGYPVNLTVGNALELDMNYCYRSRIRRWHKHIEQGDDLSRSASRCGIGRTIAWALDDSLNKGNAPLILESLEEVYRSRYNYRLNLLNAIACPLMVIGLGCVVGFVVLGMFLPMVKIIQVML